LNDRLFLGVLLYITLVVLVSATLPDEIFTQDLGEESPSEIQDSFNITVTDVDSATEQVGFLFKVLSITFAPFTIGGIPTALKIIITILNLFSITISGIYIYDKVRGI